MLLTRHGHVEGIDPPRFRGRADLSLTARGIAQAEALAARIASRWRVSRIYSSPARRCRATAGAVAKACGVEPCVVDALDDIDYGAWQSRSYEEIKEAHADLFAAWFATPHLVRFPNGESLQDVLARTADVLRMIRALNDGEVAVVVGHDSVNRALLVHLLDQPQSAFWRIAQHPCCINEFEIERGRVRSLRMNDTCHLDRVEGRHTASGTA
jgi:probable phosphoglycerate mutase